MPFEKGKSGNPKGRPGYSFEKKQLEKMRALVDQDIALLEKLYEGKFTKEDIKILQLTTTRISKYMDKLHASKSESHDTKTVKLPKPLLNYLDQQTEELKKLDE